MLAAYKEEKRGPTIVVSQTLMDLPVSADIGQKFGHIVINLTFQSLLSAIPSLGDFPAIPIHISDSEGLYSVLDWQRVGVRWEVLYFY